MREPGSTYADTAADKRLMYLENWQDNDNTKQESLSLFSTVNALTIISDLKVFSAHETASYYCQQLTSTQTSHPLEERTDRFFRGKFNSLLNTSPTGFSFDTDPPGAGAEKIGLKQLSISALNCNSFNLTCSDNVFDIKTNAILSLKSDIIFLSDIRLGENKVSISTFRLSKAFQNAKYGYYELISNSTMNKRGTAILISSKLNFELIDTVKDQNENYICIHCKINGEEVVLGAIYGPNTTDRVFYGTLENYLERKRGVPIILGGDWNTTWDNSNPDQNIDIINMVNAPNQANGKLLKQMATNLNLCDPFRALYPDKLEFSYTLSVI
jgi:exonuclease III